RARTPRVGTGRPRRRAPERHAAHGRRRCGRFRRARAGARRRAGARGRRRRGAALRSRVTPLLTPADLGTYLRDDLLREALHFLLDVRRERHEEEVRHADAAVALYRLVTLMRVADHT